MLQNGLPSPGHFVYYPPFFVPACLFSGPPGCRLLTTHPCSSIGAHGVMVCVVVTQSDLHYYLPSRPPPFPSPCHPVEPSFRPPCPFFTSPPACPGACGAACDLTCMQLALATKGHGLFFHTFQRPGTRQPQTQAGCQRLHYGVILVV